LKVDADYNNKVLTLTDHSSGKLYSRWSTHVLKFVLNDFVYFFTWCKFIANKKCMRNDTSF